MDPVSHRVFRRLGNARVIVSVSSLLRRVRARYDGRRVASRTTNQQSPRFLVAACHPGTTDAPGHPLQRLQIIKGWVGQGGQFHQQVIDVAGNADNGASVDPASCETTGTGFASLCGVWTDPSFDASQDAVITLAPLKTRAAGGHTAMPTATGERAARWLLEPTDTRTIQERAWTAPLARRRCDTQIASRRTMTHSLLRHFGSLYCLALG